MSAVLPPADPVTGEDPKAILAQASLLLHREGASVAFAAVEKALKRYPENTPLLVRRGVLLRHLRGPQAAVDWFTALAERFPKDQSLLHELALSQRDLGDLAAAAATLEHLLKLRPDHPAGLLAQANLLLQTKGREAALAALQSALARLPDNPTMMAQASSLLRRVSGPQAAISWLEKLSDQLPSDAVRLHELALSQRVAADLTGALRTVDLLLQAQPDHPSALLTRVNLVLQISGAEAALEALDAALALLPNNANLLWRRGHLLRLHQGPQAAIDWLQGLSERLPVDPGRLHELAAAQREAADPEAALATLDLLLQGRRDHASGLLSRANLLLQTEGPAAGLAAVEAALVLQPQNEALLVRRGHMISLVKGPQEAIAWLEGLAGQLSEDDARLVELAAARRVAGDIEGALLDYRRLLARTDAAVSDVGARAALALARMPEAPLDLLQRARDGLRLNASLVADNARLVVEIRLAEDDPEGADLLTLAQTSQRNTALPAAAQIQLLKLLETGGHQGAAEDLLRNLFEHGPLAPEIVHLLLSRLVENDQQEAARDVLPGLMARVAAEHRLKVETSAWRLIDGPEIAFAKGRKLARNLTMTPPQALQMGTMLSQLGRYALAARYLSRALRRWPRVSSLLVEAQAACIRQGNVARAWELMDKADAQGLIDHEARAQARILLYQRTGAREEFLQAAAERRLENGTLLKSAAQIQTLILSPSQSPAIRALRDEMLDPETRIAAGNAPHFSPSSIGAMINEAQLASRHSGEMAHAVFVAPAVAVLDAWDAARVSGAVEKPGRIPLRIMQYWSQGRPDAAISDLMEGWKRLYGFEHVLLDRNSALLYLRRHLGPKWAHALTLTRNMAEEADYFRLCWLAHSGGLYIDADDGCLRSPRPLLERSAGLLIYRENSGAVGNNVLASAPMHPVMLLAARMARDSILRKEGDNTWTKTGPGLLTRALAVYLKQREAAGQAADVTLLAQHDITPFVHIHVPLPYKQSRTYWNKVGWSDPHTYISLLQSLQETAPR